MVKFIAILYFLATGIIFDCFAVPKSTNWSIFYFTSLYLFVLIIAIDELLFTNSKIIKYHMISAIALLLLLIGRELSLINMSYDIYMQSIDSIVAKIIGIAFISISSLIILINYILCHVHSKRK